MTLNFAKVFKVRVVHIINEVICKAQLHKILFTKWKMVLRFDNRDFDTRDLDSSETEHFDFNKKCLIT